MNINLDKNLNIPIYQQIIQHLTEKIEKEELKNGDRLPTEREISKSIGISRGTVKKAYDELVRQNILEAVQGRGTFVKWKKENRKNQTSQYFRQIIVRAKSLELSRGEMSALLYAILNQELNVGLVSIASIDCNPEALEIFSRQISNHQQTRVYPFILKEVHDFSNPEEVFQYFDLILTTTTHFEEVQGLLASQKDKIIRAAAAPDLDTIVGLAGLKPDTRIGILSKTPRFAHIIRNIIGKTNDLLPLPPTPLLTQEADEERFRLFLEDKQTLIMPPLYTLNLSLSQEKLLLAYCTQGGAVIPFHYAIEKGSLIHISERITQIVHE